MKSYAIANTIDKGMWWDSNEGWVNEDHEPTLFSESERDAMDLPENGRWIPVRI